MLIAYLQVFIFQRRYQALGSALLVGAALLFSTSSSTAQSQTNTMPATPARQASGLVADIKTSAATAAPVAAGPVSSSLSGDGDSYGLAALWQQGDWVAKGCLLLLGLMSFASWYALLAKLLALKRLTAQTRDADHVFSDVRLFASHMATLTLDNPIRHVADAGSVAVHQYAALKPRVDYDTWIVRAIEQALNTVQMRLQGSMTLLATIGSTAPVVGLFGTVWAIYIALVKIGVSGQASVDRVAGPVGEALILTAIGLAVAVPALVGYNWLLRQNKLAFEGVRGFGAQLHSLLLATTDLTAMAAPPADSETPDKAHAESEFDSSTGSLNAHLSSPNAAPDIRL